MVRVNTNSREGQRFTADRTSTERPIDRVEGATFDEVKEPPQATNVESARPRPVLPDAPNLPGFEGNLALLATKLLGMEPVSDAQFAISEMRIALDGVLASLDSDPPLSRSDRYGRWVVSGELRKMAKLEQYLNGYVKG